MATMPLTTKTIQVNVVYLLLGAGVIFGMGGAIGGVVAAVAMKVVGKGVSNVTAAPVPKPKYTREELIDAVMGKNEQEVIEMFGKPKTTSGSGGFGTWYYDAIRYDRVTGKTDMFTGIKFQGGIVVSVNNH